VIVMLGPDAAPTDWTHAPGFVRPSPGTIVCSGMGATMTEVTAGATAPTGLDAEDVWAQVGASLERFVRRRVSDPHQAEDVVADVLLRIHEHLGDLDDRERVTAWVFRIARNAITDHYRRTGRRRETPDADPEPTAAGGADTWLDDQEAVLGDLASCIRPLVDALPGDYRRALELTDLQGRTQVEAARIEQISLSGMKSRVQRGRRQFAALVRNCCEVTTDNRGELVDFRLRPDGCGCSPDGSTC
jgi:RNA polymerase sigma-70 factor (ECF subfamily)